MNNKRARNFQDLTGARFTRLTVTAFDGTSDRTKWHCRCDCGKTVSVNADALKAGRTKSCGCLQAERRAETHTTHGAWKGGTETTTHRSWRMMMARCYEPSNNRYASYGGMGIKVCEQWKEFQHFLGDMGERPPGMTLDRIDSNRDYSKENCRWASQKQQQNNRRNNRLITANGETMTMSQWAERTGIGCGTIFSRLEIGWSEEKSVTTPVFFRGQPQASR